MLSKMGGRLIAFYADDLAELLLEDFLKETVKDLQKIEEQDRKQYAVKETEIIAENIMLAIADYQAEEHLVDTRWCNKDVQRSIKGHSLGDFNSQPKPIQFDFNRDMVDVKESY
jgi:hypothetical protein